MEDIPAFLKHWAEVNGTKEVFVFYNEAGRTSVLTAGDVYLLSSRFAARLRDWGFQTGDLISNALPNCAERVVTDFGIVMAGCVVTSLQAVEKDGRDMWYAMQSYQSAGVILPRHPGNGPYSIFQEFLPPAIPPSGCVPISVPRAPSIKRAILIERHHQSPSSSSSFLDSLRQGKEESFINPDIRPTSLAYIIPTSGSTGYSKLIARTHASMATIARSFSKTPPTKRVTKKQLGWIAGFPFSYLGNCSASLIQDFFEGQPTLGPDVYWQLLESEKCDMGFLFPSELRFLLDHFSHNGVPEFRLRIVITGGQPLTKDLISRSLGVISDSFLVSYASTECGIVSAGLIKSPDQMEDFKTGPLNEGVQVKIVDHLMQEVDAGTQGILLVKSPFAIYQYYNLPTPKNMCTDDGYFITGDRGWMNQDGVLYVSDRHDDVIHYGPLLVYPSWPQNILEKIPGVVESVVVGIPQEDADDKLGACVLVGPGFSLTKDDVISAYNSHFMDTRDAFFPRLAHLEVVQSLPRTTSGKVDKRKIRDIILTAASGSTAD